MTRTNSAAKLDDRGIAERGSHEREGAILGSGQTARLFISRAGPDAGIAQKIGVILEAVGQAVILQDWDFKHKNFMGQMQRAPVPLYKRSLEIREKALGPDHPDVGTSLNNLAVLYYGMGKREDAVQYIRRGSDVLLKALGPDHPSTKKAMQVRDIFEPALKETQS